MPRVEAWDHFPPALRSHLIERMRDRKIAIADLEKLRRWIETEPVVPAGEWCKDFGSFKICGEGQFPKTSLLAGQPAGGEKL